MQRHDPSSAYVAVDGHDADSRLRRLPDGPWKGAGVLDRSFADVGADQTVRFAVARRATGRVEVEVTNTGTVSEAYGIASQVSGGGARLTVWADGTNITRRVPAGSYATEEIDPGGSRRLVLRFKVPRTARHGAVRSVYLHAYPAGDSSHKDVVRAQVVVR